LKVESYCVGFADYLKSFALANTTTLNSQLTTLNYADKHVNDHLYG